MTPQVWHPGARVSRPHPHEYDSLQPGQKRRRRRAQYGTLGAAVAGQAGRFHVTWDDGEAGFGSISGSGRMPLAPYGAGRHNLSPLPQRRRVARSRRGVDAAQEEGDAAEPENSDDYSLCLASKKRVNFDQNKRPRRVLMPRKGRRRRRKLAPPPEHEGKLHNKPHEAKGRPMLLFTFVRQTRAKKKDRQKTHKDH